MFFGFEIVLIGKRIYLICFRKTIWNQFLNIYSVNLLKIGNGPNRSWLTKHVLEWINRTYFVVDGDADLHSVLDMALQCWSAAGVAAVGVVVGDVQR